MTTRITHSVPVVSGFAVAGYQAWHKGAAYLAMLGEAFAEAKAQARAAQARYAFISE
jgi:predicted lipoprotein